MKSGNTHYFGATIVKIEREREISCRYLFKIASRNYCVKNPHNNRDFSIVDLSHGHYVCCAHTS